METLTSHHLQNNLTALEWRRRPRHLTALEWRHRPCHLAALEWRCCPRHLTTLEWRRRPPPSYHARMAISAVGDCGQLRSDNKQSTELPDLSDLAQNHHSP